MRAAIETLIPLPEDMDFTDAVTEPIILPAIAERGRFVIGVFAFEYGQLGIVSALRLWVELPVWTGFIAVALSLALIAFDYAPVDHITLFAIAAAIAVVTFIYMSWSRMELRKRHNAIVAAAKAALADISA